jgi:RNA methyltransferase, TrmH family
MTAVNGLAFHNQHVQRLRRLLGRRSSRLDESVVVVEGAKVIDEALSAGHVMETLFVTEGAEVALAATALALGANVFMLARGVMERVADTVSPQPCAAIFRWVAPQLASLSVPLGAGGFIVAGVDIRDPGNAGTLIRSAEVSGACGVVLCADSVDVTSPKVVRSSAGSLFHLPVVTDVSVADLVAFSSSAGARTWGAAVLPGTSVPYDSVDFTSPTVLVMGNEAHGLSGADTALLDGLVTIPMAGRTESLNVSMASTVLCFEVARQRRHLIQR